MKIKLESTFGQKNYRGTNERGQSVQFSGDKQAVGPMESVLMAAAACSSIDVELILLRMRQDFVSLEVLADAERAKDQIPSVFTKIHLHFVVKGRGLKDEKVKKAVGMSIESYCSVSKMLEKTAVLTHSYEIVEVTE